VPEGRPEAPCRCIAGTDGDEDASSWGETSSQKAPSYPVGLSYSRQHLRTKRRLLTANTETEITYGLHSGGVELPVLDVVGELVERLALLLQVL
jgi:hypothetical protein